MLSGLSTASGTQALGTGYASIPIGDNGDELHCVCDLEGLGITDGIPEEMLLKFVNPTTSGTRSLQLTSFDVYTYPA